MKKLNFFRFDIDTGDLLVYKVVEEELAKEWLLLENQKGFSEELHHTEFGTYVFESVFDAAIDAIGTIKDLNDETLREYADNPEKALATPKFADKLRVAIARTAVGERITLDYIRLSTITTN